MRAFRVLGALLIAVVVTMGGVTAASTAPAASAASASGSSATAATAVGECLATGQVWLLIVTEAGERLRSECVGTPATGADALAAADVAATQSAGGYLCTLAGHPEQCPRRFDGQYWQYWHADGVGEKWRYSDVGASLHQVQPGSIEGWCRNAPGTHQCSLPALQAEEVPSPRKDSAPTQPNQRWVGYVAGLMALGVVVVALTGRRGSARAAARRI